MTANSSFFPNESLHPPHLPSVSSLSIYMKCLISGPSSFIYTSYNITYILLLLPLCIFILHRGLQQWRTTRSASSAAPMCPADSITYHMVTMELVGLVGCVLCISKVDVTVVLVGLAAIVFTWFGQMLFNVLTCVERYLAVVHPITYLSLRQERGVRIRNVTIGCVWLLCVVETCVTINDEAFVITALSLLILCLTIASFCSLSVLRVLIRPGPGEQGGNRKKVDQSKQRAFYTMVAIMGVLVVRFAVNLAWSLIYSLMGSNDCVLLVSQIWANLPSSLVLPLLYLHRKGKGGRGRKNIKAKVDLQK